MKRVGLSLCRVIASVVTFGGFLSFGAELRAEAPLKQLVLDDCTAAKKRVADDTGATDPQLIVYLIDVLNLKLASDLQPVAPSQLVTKWQDPSPARLETSHLDRALVGPLSVIDSAAERGARRCAVELLGMLGGKASTALPELVHYASQSELDDVARFEAETALFRIAAQSGPTLIPATLVELVQGLRSDREELVRSVLLMLAPTRIAQIASLLLTDPTVPDQSAADLFRELYWGEQDNARSVFQDLLTHGEYAARRKALVVLEKLGWDLESLHRFVDAALISGETAPLSSQGRVGPPAIEAVAAKIILRSGAPCSRVAPQLLDPLFRALSSEGDIGAAAARRLGCAAEAGQTPQKTLLALVQSHDPRVRARSAQILAVAPEAGKLKLQKKLAEDADSAVRAAVLDRIIFERAAYRAAGRELLLSLAISLANDPTASREHMQALLERIAQFGVGSMSREWQKVLPKLLRHVAVQQKTELLTEQGGRTVTALMRAIEGKSGETAMRLSRSSSMPERLLGAQLLASSLSQGASGVVGRIGLLLADPAVEVREYVLEALAGNFDRIKGGTKGLLAAQSPLVRGAVAALSMQDPKSGAAQIRVAASWLQQASCSELFAVFSEPLVKAPSTRAVISSRLLPCLKAERRITTQMVSALRSASDLTSRVVQGVLDSSLDPQMALVLSQQTSQWKISPEQVLELFEVAWKALPIAQGAHIVSLAKQTGVPERDLAHALEDFAERAGTDSKSGCIALWTASSLMKGEYDWKSRFKAEIKAADEPFVTCAAEGDGEVAQQALTELLVEAPARNQAALLRRLAVVPELRSEEKLQQLLDRALQSPNEEIRCQGTRVAMRITEHSEPLIAAARRALYGKCWDELKADVEVRPSGSVAEALLHSAANYLEQVRALQLRGE